MFKKIVFAGLLGLASLAPAAHADGPVRLIIAFPPGGPVDLVGRVDVYKRQLNGCLQG